MSKTISQKVLFKNTKPQQLYELYMNSKRHSLATGAPAKMSTKKGGKYSAHNGYISGENLQLVKNRMIVQTWRAQSWDKEDTDSIFIISLEQKNNDTVLFATHANVPEKHAASIEKGWQDHYWKPWKKYLTGKPIGEYPTM